MDSVTNLKQLKELVQKFCEDRDWDQFHSAKDLAIGITTESAELLDLFRFKSQEEIELKMAEPKYRQQIENELADVLFFIIRFSQKNNFDLTQSLNNKIKINSEKYPISTSKGSNKKYNE